MKLCIIGTGYVGLVSAACFAEMGNTVNCVDVNEQVINKLNSGIVHIYEPGLTTLVKTQQRRRTIKLYHRFKKAIAGVECVFICVGTPPWLMAHAICLTLWKQPGEIGQNMTNDLVVVDKSTVPVGTADKVKPSLMMNLKNGMYLTKRMLFQIPNF